MTPELQHAVSVARLSMRSDAQGTPRPFERRVIYQLLGPLTDETGRRRRVALDSAAARYVLPVISEAFYDDDPEGQDVSTPKGLLATAERVLTGDIVEARLYIGAVDACKLALAANMGGMDASKKERALFAWLACAVTLRTAIGEDPFVSLQLDRQTPESEIDFDDADAARWAAEAVAAEVGTWNVRACREFWEWWLTEAVPAAWHGTIARSGTLSAE